MSEALFTVSTFTIPASHVREYHGGARSSAAALKLRLAVKRYTPREQDPLPDALTIIAAQATGIPKETYEPMWDSLLQSLPPGAIRGIWFADCVNHASSATLNEGLLGDDPNWFDHARDLSCLVNQFAADMPQPIVGIGHSMGCGQLLRLSSSHARLMCGLALIEPVVQPDAPPGPNPALGSSYRPDWWPSRTAAEESFRKSKFLSLWNEAAFAKLLEFGLTETPTETHPQKGGVTLSTSKAQEAWGFVRGNFNELGDDESERRASPDVSKERRRIMFGRPEASQLHEELPYVRPNVLYVFGEKSMINLPHLREDKMKRTGTGLNGNGGVAAGNVEGVTLKGGMHMLPMERVEDVVANLAPWLQRQMTAYTESEQWYWSYDRGTSERPMPVLSKQWMKMVRRRSSDHRSMKGKL